MGVLICDIFSKKSSLKERARLANFVPRKLPLCPDDPGNPLPDDGVIVPLSQSTREKTQTHEKIELIELPTYEKFSSILFTFFHTVEKK